ncbi:hypothetical protein GCM10009555_081340 [Acrocarpospora macrocephala]|uniref:DUF695 domain-containing protein n=1 Tax=Acrocarpospora macrocephala TaxID=150177 RepID=A0A5M3WY20_9ACTN|nr:DUF695 domain-containing protein [Acrocarpospora macrocephala]GES10978.1 hypothetical protein Amac_045750 [Acrocarpospora macrocephala]
MRLFGRKSEPVDPGALIAAFWTWWDEARPRVDVLVDAGEAGELAELVGPAVTALDASLIWEVAPGLAARHALVVSAAGNPELRSFAHRWALAGPAADERWEFHPSRQANPQALGLTIDVGGHQFGMDRFVLGVRVPPGTPRVNVSAYHPIFQDIDDETRMETTLLALDWLLGEDEVARWIGDIIAAEFEPIDAIPAIHLPGVVADVAQSFPADRWILMEGQTGTGKPLKATARFPLRPVDYPLFDQHIAITVPYRASDPDGLPTPETLATLTTFEAQLTATLTKNAVLAAHLTTENTRTYHIYASPTENTAPTFKTLTWPEGRPRITINDDPSWSAVAHFLT